MADYELRPIESDDTYLYDAQAAVQQARARTAASRYRSENYPSYFEPVPSAPSDDPPPPTEDGDTLPNQSNRVNYYDGLSTGHRTTTVGGVTRYNTALLNYASYYNAHVKGPNDPNYEMPVSQVQPMNIEDDEADRPNESNLVNAYDVAAGGYSAISVSSTATTGARGVTYNQNMAAANAKFDALQSQTNVNGIKKKFEALKQFYDERHKATGSGVTDRSQMSVMQAGTADVATMKSGMDGMKDTVMYKGTDPLNPGTSSNPAQNTLNWIGSDVATKLTTMVTNVRNGLIAISEYNAMRDDMQNYVEAELTYSRWLTDHGSLYSQRFTSAMMQTCWNTVYSGHNQSS